MPVENIGAWERVVESSPTIVVVLLAGYWFLGSLMRLIFQEMVKRLDAKDAQVMQIHKDTLDALEEVRGAVQQLADALRDADRK